MGNSGRILTAFGARSVGLVGAKVAVESEITTAPGLVRSNYFHPLAGCIVDAPGCRLRLSRRHRLIITLKG